MLSPFYRIGNWSTEKLSNLPEDRQLINNRDRIQVQDSLVLEYVLLVSETSTPTIPCMCITGSACIIRLFRLINLAEMLTVQLYDFFGSEL